MMQECLLYFSPFLRVAGKAAEQFPELPPGEGRWDICLGLLFGGRSARVAIGLILWMDKILHRFATMVEANVCWYLRWGIESFQGF